MADVLWPLAWFLFGPVAGLLSSPWTVIPTAVGLCVPALFLGAGLGAAGERLIAAARVDVVAAALAALATTLSLAAPDHSTSHRIPETRRETTR